MSSRKKFKAEWLDCGKLRITRLTYPLADIVIGNRCSEGCPFCSSDSVPTGKDYEDLCLSWSKGTGLMLGKRLEVTEVPRRIRIGIIGEPTGHPELPEFLDHIGQEGKEITLLTNGVILGTPGDPRKYNILRAIRDNVKEVVIGVGNKKLMDYQDRAIAELSCIPSLKISMSHILGTQESAEEIFGLIRKRPGINHYVNPLESKGRSIKSATESSRLWMASRGVWKPLDKANIILQVGSGEVRKLNP